MKKLILPILLLALFCTAAVPQQQQTNEQTARLVDFFGEIQISDLKARLDNFAIELQNTPDSKGFIVVYAAKQKFPGWPLRRANYSLSYLINSRGLDAARVSVFSGELRDATTFELWVVNAGAELPVKPFDTSLLMVGEKTPLPFDRFTVMERGDPTEYEEYEPYPDAEGLYEYFADALRHDPGLRGCIIAYTSRRGSRVADRRIASRAKMAIAKAHAIDVSRLVALGGGRREYKMVELWLVPPGAELPKPTPTIRPKKRKR
ncbi:MAG: hypothetical protein H7Z38_10195 [Rubrivivax sp.]|nr:hypothetical protein [Pyrinomonadaceae bacterium]